MTTLRYKNVVTFNIILGIVGGINSLILSTLSLLMSWYSSFRYESTLIKHLYTETTYEHNDDNPINLKRKIDQYKPFRYSMREFICINLLYFVTCCNCCCRELCAKGRKQRFIKYEYARKRM